MEERADYEDNNGMCEDCYWTCKDAQEKWKKDSEENEELLH